MPDHPTPAELYARHLAEEQATTPHPSALRALALTIADLDRAHPADTTLFGASVRQALNTCRDTTGGPR